MTAVEAPESPQEPPEDLARVWVALEEVGRPELLRVASRDSCVASSRLVQEVLSYFGWRAKCQRAMLVACNARFQELMLAERIRWDERLPDWAVEEGAWALGMGSPPGMREGVGHVVCLSGAWLMDLSLDQASRPERRMTLEPTLIQLQYREGELQARGMTEEGCLLMWRVFDDQSWRGLSPDWTKWHQRYGFIAGKVIRAIKEG